MSMIPEVKCRRCGESFSSMRSRCPNCGTRRVTQSTRTPTPTSGTVKGTAAYERAEANTKWQMILGLILVVAVILSVIVMVSTSLDGADNVQSKVTAPIAAASNIPVIEAAPTTSPTPTPSLEKIEIKNYENTVTDITMRLSNNEVVTLTAIPYPMTVEGVRFTWSVSDDSVLQLTPSEDTQSCEVAIIGTVDGGAKLTVSAFGVEQSVTIRCIN